LFKTDEKKEHILKVHPWDSLTLAASKIHKEKLNRFSRVDKSQTAKTTASKGVSVKSSSEVDSTIEKDLGKKLTCSMCDRSWTLHAKTNISQLKSSIKGHMYKVHFEADMQNILSEKFKDNSCEICSVKVNTVLDQKKHLQGSHGIFDVTIDPKVEGIINSGLFMMGKSSDNVNSSLCVVKSEYFKNDKISSSRKRSKSLAPKSRTKRRKLDGMKSINIDEVTEENSISPVNHADKKVNMEETDEFKELQACIEYSDSDSEDNDTTDNTLNEIQKGISYSDSDADN